MANGFLSTDSLVPYGNQMIPNTVVTAPRLKPKGDGKNDKLALMLYALGGALKGDKNFVENTMKLQQMQEGKKREKEMKENWQKALGNLEGSVNPTLVELARVVGPEKGAGLIASGLPKKEDKKTAAMLNLDAYNQIKAKGNPEDIAMAEIVLIGARQNKSIEQMKKELTASLLKQTDPLGDPLSKEEINNRLKLFDFLLGGSAASTNIKNSPTQIEGYEVVEVE